MMECLTPELIDRYCSGDVDSLKEVRAIDAHLAACAACREAVRSVVSGAAASLVQKLTLTPGESACLSVDSFMRYLQGETDAAEIEIVNAHVEACARCAESLASLRALHQQRETAAQPSSGWARLREWLLTSSRRWLALQTTGVAAVAVVTALLVFYVTTRPMQKQVADLQTQVSQLQQTKATLEKQVALMGELKTQLAQLRQDYQTAQTTAATLQTRLAQLEKSQIPVSEAAKSQIALVLNDGGKGIAVDKQGNYVRTEPLPPVVKDALKNQRVKPPALLAELIGGQSVLRSDADKGVPFALFSPVGTVVQTDRPTFRWQPLDGANSYTVTVVDDANDKTAAKSDPLTGTEWTIPNALKHGGVYRWFVTALKGEEKIQSPNKAGVVAKFKVLEQKQVEELKRAKRTYANSHLTLGVLYAQTGLLEDAEREFQALLNANPKSSVAQKLLDSVKAMRRQ